MKRVFALFAALFLPMAIASAKQIKLRGYVTEIHSPTSFDIDDYRITRDQSLALEFEKERDDSEDLPRDIRIGTEVEIKGDYDDTAHELRAKTIKVYPADTRKLKRTAILEQSPNLKSIGSKWEGELRVDGQTLIIDQATAVTVVPNATQKKALKQAEKARKKNAAATEGQEQEVALTTLSDVHPEMYVAYEGRRLDDGRVQTTKVSFKDNELTSGEARLWKSLKPKVRAFKTGAPGEIRVAGVKAKTVLDRTIQKYVSDLALSLLPEPQTGLGSGNPNKIPSRCMS